MLIHNPILRGFHPDPSICRAGEDYYIATSTFEWFPGVEIHHSRDLKHWELLPRPLERVSQLDLAGKPDSGGVWAPCLSYSDGQFWLIYTNVQSASRIFKDAPNYLVTCSAADGRWSEPIFLNSSGFDPSLFHDDDGRKYLVNLVWDHREGRNPFHGICIQEYSHRQKKLVGKPQLIFRGTSLGLTEAPHLYKKDGFYYLMTAEGGTSYEHAVTVARSRSLTGPYEVHPHNPILTSYHDPELPLQKAGHASMVETPSGNWYLVHLCGRPLKMRGRCPLGRETAIQKVVWKDGWPWLEQGNTPAETIEVTEFAEHPFPDSWPGTDHFDGPVLNRHFQTPRIPADGFASLTERPGHLRLYGGQSLISGFGQAHVARRWQSVYFDAEVKVEFHPETFQQMAGLTMYYNQKNWFFFHATWDEEKGRAVQLSHMDRGTVYREYLKGAELPALPDSAAYVYLRVRVRGGDMTFQWSADGCTYQQVPGVFDGSQLSDDYVIETSHLDECFTGAFVGMACMDLSGCRKPADFDCFSYLEQ